MAICTTCRGSGKNILSKTCSSCTGSQKIQCVYCKGTGKQMIVMTCNPCKGSGLLQCNFCNGSGLQSEITTCSACAGTGIIADSIIASITPLKKGQINSLRKRWMVATFFGLFLADSIAGAVQGFLGDEILTATLIGGITGGLSEFFIGGFGAVVGVLLARNITNQQTPAKNNSSRPKLSDILGGLFGYIVGEVISTGIQNTLEPRIGESFLTVIVASSLIGGALSGIILASIQWKVINNEMKEIGLDEKFFSWTLATMAGSILYMLTSNIIYIFTNANEISSIIISLAFVGISVGCLLTFGQWLFLRKHFNNAAEWITSGFKGGLIGGVLGSLLTAWALENNAPPVISFLTWRVSVFLMIAYFNSLIHENLLPNTTTRTV